MSFRAESAGSEAPEILIVGRNAGQKEVSLGWAFSNDEGAYLRGLAMQLGIPEDDIRFTKVFKSVSPSETEIASFFEEFIAEVEASKPKAILALGGDMLQMILNEEGIMKNRGRQHMLEINEELQIPVIFTYNPRMVLANNGKSGEWVLLDLKTCHEISCGIDAEAEAFVDKDYKYLDTLEKVDWYLAKKSL